MIEFYFAPKNTLRDRDVIYVDGKMVPYEKLSPNLVEQIFADLTRNDRIRHYMVTLYRKHITDHVELIKHCARRFFPLLDNIPDIALDGSLNIEVQ